ncbi:translocation/assembly module TamB domain-containing protein [Arcticibacter svalbardensis]|uniref:translocation/assembly module TamB domain-containing protein n=1 Tax=Arcticibacter svalbardensis TaxID=1288027 RepID=UPI00058D1DDE|nr:translocation/assembly module TamB domain-containing protein [Arcticibacter svalbardensis]
MRRFGTLTLKIILWIIGILIFLVLLVFVLIRVPAVQNFAKNKAVSYLEGKIGTKVEINKISLNLPKLIVLEDIYFEDQKKDTLLAGDTLKVDISLLKLLNNKLEINEIDLRGITANIQRGPDSVFNFDYIMKAFVSEQKKEPEPVDTSSTMKFSLDKINLDRIKVSFKDAPSANDVQFAIGHFDTRIKEFDLDKMKFSIPKIVLSGVNARVIQSKPAVVAKTVVVHEAESAEPMNLDLQLGTIDLSKIKVFYQNDVSAMKADVNLGSLVVESDQIDMKNQHIILDKLDLSNSSILFQLGKSQQAKLVASETEKATEATSTNWKFDAKDLNLGNNNIRFDNFNMPVQKKGMDFAHMDIKDLNLSLNDLAYSVDTISGKINSGTFKDKSGFNLLKFETEFFYGPKEAYLKDLLVQTPYTSISNNIRVTYPSIASISTHLGELGVEANLIKTKIGFKDILILAPDLVNTVPLKGNPNAVLNINGKVKGKVKNLEIENLQISGLGGTIIKASAKTRGLPDMNKAWLDINIDEFSTRRSDILALVPKGTIPANVRIPESIKLTGKFKGGMTNFSTDLNLFSSFGSAKAIATYNASVKGRESYKANVRIFNFDVGRMIKNDSIGRITLAANVVGNGLNPKTMRARAVAKVIKAEYNHYTYRNFSFDGSASRGNMMVKADMPDPNLKFNLTASANMSGTYPAIKLNLDLDSANLQNLHFVKENMRFHGKLVADLPTADPDYLNGSILLTEALFTKADERIGLDTVSIISTASADSNTLRLRSEVMSADLKGKYKLTQLGTALQDLIGKYYLTGPKVKPAIYGPQQLVFNAKIANGPLIQKFVPDLKELATIVLDGNFDSQKRQLNVNGSIPRILYGTNDLSNFQMKINTADSALSYALTLDKITTGSMQILKASVAGNVSNNTITTAIQTQDNKGRADYRIAGALKALQDAFQFSLNPDGLVLNHTPWTVSQNNAIHFGAKGIEATNFVLSNNNQQLSINSSPPGLNNPLVIDFKNFQIETLTNIAKQDSLLAGGTINGNAQVRNFNTTPIFTSDMTVSNFSFMGDTVGNIALKVNNEQANTFAADVKITGQGNQVNLNGLYYTNNSSFDMKLDIANLNMKSIEGFTMGSVKQSKGFLQGKLDITGTTTAPAIRGGIDFKEVAFNVAMLNSYFKIQDNARIGFTEDGITFNDFALIDSANNKAQLLGTVYTKTYTDFRFDLKLNANNFKLINSAAKDNDLFYGKLFIDTRLGIKGTVAAPSVDGSLKIDPETDFTLVLPASDPGIQDRAGIVEFVDKDNPQLAKVFKDPADTLNSSTVTGMDVSVNIELDKEAQLNVLVDPANGDMLRLKGAAQLNGGIDPSGKVSLTGNLTVEEGSYDLSLSFLKRKFLLKKGSTLTWNGEPMMADADITATYVANTAPIDLVEQQLGSVAQTTLNTYKQKLPFNVNLMLKGELMKPTITFDIILPEENYNVSTEVITTVDNRLTQLRTEPSELNKQVFAVLLLNRFISDNPFASSAGGGGLESSARQSVSRLLSDQLNNLAGDMIGGVQLEFDLQSSEDYTTGQMANRTDLNVGLSKRLLNDRLKVTVGSNFELEGPQQQNRKTSNIAGDIQAEYQLSNNGRYILRAYQKNQYQVALQGQVIETGVGFVISMDYNQFKEIFGAKTREEKRRQRARKSANETTKEND